MKRLIISIILCLLCIYPCFVPIAVYATEQADTVDFDSTYVLTDLAGRTILGKQFNALDYPFVADGEVQMLDFVEYCYSRYPNLQDRYGLYLYIYNPTGVEIKDSILNTVQIATEYGGDGEPITWTKYTMKLCSASTDYLFYKFKVENVDDIFARVIQDTEQRRYDISSVELFSANETTNAVDYSIGGKWVYTGFGKGCDLTSEESSTLQAVLSPFQVLVLDDLQFTYYRVWQDMNNELADQLTSVYFAVDNSIANLYDELYSIQAETYQYLTTPIFCVAQGLLFVNIDTIFERYLGQVGVDTSLSTNQWGGMWNSYADGYAYGGGYNSLLGDHKLDTLSWLFKVEADSEYTVNSNELLQYAVDYSATRDKSIRGKYSADLFADKYYTSNLSNTTFESGHLPIDISVDDEFTLVGSDRRSNAWDILSFGLSFDNGEQDPLCPIVAVTSNDIINLTDEELSIQYRITENDCVAFREYVNTQSANNKVTYIFRFAQSTYFNSRLFHTNNGSSVGSVGYIAQEVAYLDFDIISLGWRKDGIVSIMPVSSNPIDIFTAVEYGGEFLDIMWNFEQVTMLLALIILLILFLYFPPLLKVFIWIVTLPAKIIIWIFNLFKRLFGKRKK